jgi:dienelactone hydrolase
MVKYAPILPLLSTIQGTFAIGGPSYPINVEPHNYTDSEGVLLQGFLSKPSNDEQNQYPAVIILHDQDGPDAYEQQRATLVAQELGYIGFAADIYGFGVELPEDDGTWGGPRAEFIQSYLGNATRISTRIQAAVDYIQSLEYVDSTKVALIGYCFGGTGVVHYLNTRGSDSTVAGACGVHPSLMGDWGGPFGSIHVPALFLTGGSDFLTGPEASELVYILFS